MKDDLILIEQIIKNYKSSIEKIKKENLKTTNIIYEEKINNILSDEQEINEKKRKLEENEMKLEKMCYMNKIMEIILNTYYNYSNNYYNCLNINNIITCLYENEEIKKIISNNKLNINYNKKLMIKLRQEEIVNDSIKQIKEHYDEITKEKIKENENLNILYEKIYKEYQKTKIKPFWKRHYI